MFYALVRHLDFKIYACRVECEAMAGAPQRYAPYPVACRPRRPLAPIVAQPSAGLSCSRRIASPSAPPPPGSVAPSLDLGALAPLWPRLPWPLLRALADAGFRNAAALADVSSAQAIARLPPDIASRYWELVEELLRPRGPRLFNFFRAIAGDVGSGSTSHLHTFTDAPYVVLALRRGHLTPTRNLEVLRFLQGQGHNPQAVCDAIADARAGAGVQPATARTYDSHLRQIEKVCATLDESPLPASLDTIRRVTAVIGNPATMRGWLAAWRRLHMVARLLWAGDRDPYLIAIRAGLRRTIGPPPPRLRCRRSLLRRLLAHAAQRGFWHEGAFAALSYYYGLRAPSELVRQATAAAFRCEGRRITYGPIRRKGKDQSQMLRRWCVCHSEPLICPHPWIELLRSGNPHGFLFARSAASLMGGVVTLLKDLGVPQADRYTSHCFRRGAGVDVLEAHGLQAMLSFGQWSSPQSAEPYASSDEQSARALGHAIADCSDEES
jgi:hypothetical protein